jgi:hypothetical protein
MSESLQFERAEYATGAPARTVCTACSRDVIQSYYEIGGQIICSECRESRERGLASWGVTRFFRAAAAGLAVGLAGAAVWYLIRHYGNVELGIISIFIGLGVGKAVRWGSAGRGGWLYQLLAMFLTYSAIVLNYVPDIAAGIADGKPANAVIYIIAFVLSYAAPFFDAFDNIIGLLIIAFGIWEAWKINKRAEVTITGPYSVSAAAAPVPNV